MSISSVPTNCFAAVKSNWVVTIVLNSQAKSSIQSWELTSKPSGYFHQSDLVVRKKDYKKSNPNQADAMTLGLSIRH